MPRCLVDGCPGTAPAAAPVALCPHHLALAAAWAGERDGVSDVLPSPCLLCGSRLGVRWPSGWLCAVCEWPHAQPVDAELPPVRVDVVYYLGFADRVKIGTTANPRRRLAAIRHDHVLAFERGDRRVEAHRHRQFAVERLGGTEWFASSDRLRSHVDALRGGSDPWDTWTRWRSVAETARG